MRDPAKFTDATIFNPFRFCGNKTPAASGPQHSSGQFRGTLTDASEDWLVWGLGRILWSAFRLLDHNFKFRLTFIQSGTILCCGYIKTCCGNNASQLRLRANKSSAAPILAVALGDSAS